MPRIDLASRSKDGRLRMTTVHEHKRSFVDLGPEEIKMCPSKIRHQLERNDWTRFHIERPHEKVVRDFIILPSRRPPHPAGGLQTAHRTISKILVPLHSLGTRYNPGGTGCRDLMTQFCDVQSDKEL